MLLSEGGALNLLQLGSLGVLKKGGGGGSSKCKRARRLGTRFLRLVEYQSDCGKEASEGGNTVSTVHRTYQQPSLDFLDRGC